VFSAFALQNKDVNKVGVFTIQTLHFILRQDSHLQHISVLHGHQNVQLLLPKLLHLPLQFSRMWNSLLLIKIHKCWCVFIAISALNSVLDSRLLFFGVS
jgi:hypothetical protein